MTDGEPEPFRMSTEPDVVDDDAVEATDEPDAPDDAAADEPSAGAGESVADLIAEAARSAAAQAAARAEADEVAEDDGDDGGSAIWGDTGADDSRAVWDDADDAAGTNVWDLEDSDGTAVWDEAAAAHVPAAEDPASEAAPGPPAAAEGMDHVGHDEEEPETFAFPLAGDQRATSVVATPADEDEDEPEPFTFGAGASAPAPAPSATTSEDDDEPETFTFPIDDRSSDEAPAVSADRASDPAEDTAPTRWPVAPLAAADEQDDEDEDDEIWTFPMETTNDTPLAETAAPRDDTGWHDMDAEEEPGWAVPDAPMRRRDADEAEAEDEPEGFVARIGSDETGPRGDDGRAQPAHALAAEAQDVLEELLGHDEEPAPAAALPTRSVTPGDADELDHLDDLDDFDHLDEMGAAAGSTPDPGDATAADADEDEDEEEFAYEQPLDAPTAAREVMEPGQVTFSSGGKKRRGLFG